MRVCGSFGALTIAGLVALTACHPAPDRSAADVRIPPEARAAAPALVESDGDSAAAASSQPKPRAAVRPVLDEAGLDPQIVSWARAALECEWGRFGFHHECEAIRSSPPPQVFKTPSAQRTLVRMLEDPSDRVRLLGAMKLRGFDRSDDITAARILAAAERETSPIAAREMGVVAGSVDITKGGVFEIVRRLAKEHALFELRAGLLMRLLPENPESEQALQLVAELADDPIPEVSFSAIASLPARAKVSLESACAVLVKPLASARPRVAAHAARQAATMECTSLNDGVLDVVDAAISRDRNPDIGLISAIKPVCKSPTATADQKSRGAALAERTLKNDKNYAGYRIDAMKALVACAPQAGPAIVKLYKKDIDRRVSDAAADLTR